MMSVRFRSQLVSALAVAMLLLASSACREATQDSQATPDPADPVQARSPLAVSPAWATDADNRTLADVAEAATPSVVSIAATKVTQLDRTSPLFDDPFFRRFFGPGPSVPQERRERGLGSGVIVSVDGLVLTNHHVVASAEEIRVDLPDGRELDATVVGLDEPTDLALLRLEGDVSGLQPMTFGDSSRLRLGDVVLAIGNPFGVGQTVTMGIVSATGRAAVGIVDYEDFIQTDAAINPGNSGGALVNMEGRLVGINTAILSRSGGYQGVGFAIPAHMAQRVMDSLLEHGKVVRSWLGVAIQDVDQDLAAALGLEQARGALIAEVEAGSPADEAGLRRGDVIAQVDGEPVESTARLRNRIAAAGVGTTIELQILRDGKPRELEVELVELPAAEGAGVAPSGGLSGLQLEELSPQLRRQFGIPDGIRNGVLVAAVAPNSAAAQANLRPGDVILEANRKPIGSVADFRRVYAQAEQRVLLLVRRGGASLFLVLPKQS